jgi:hypothetical protein
MATLNVTIKEEISIYGNTIQKEMTHVISGVEKVKSEIKDVTPSVIGNDTIISFNANGTGINFEDDPKYLRITNLAPADSSNSTTITLSFFKEQEMSSFKLQNGQSFYLFNNDMYAETWGATGAWSNSIALDNIDYITAGYTGTAAPVEIFIAI